MSVKATWTDESLIKGFGEICCANKNNAFGLSEAVKLDKKFIESC